MDTNEQQIYSCFIAAPYTDTFSRTREIIKKAVEDSGFRVLPDDNKLITKESILESLSHADFVICDITQNNPNVIFELGVAQGIGKIIIFISKASSRYLRNPLFLENQKIIEYETSHLGFAILEQNIREFLEEFRQFPHKFTYPWSSKIVPSFEIDWAKLGKREIDNLIFELLSQMGFQSIKWVDIALGVDILAFFPKQDPDGFKYQEVWIISIDRSNLIENIDLLNSQSDLLSQIIMMYADRLDRNSIKRMETSITFLQIITQKISKSTEIEHTEGRIELNQKRWRTIGYKNFRFRIWNQAYLESQIQQFPQIGYKYFSEEGRIRSQTRKSYEELYKENSELVARQAELISRLEEEKDKRIRAERDAMWKDISFSAAHKIGNPIFAIETDLDPLVKRIREQRVEEAIDVVSNIRFSVEKAKSFVDQFKSLARAEVIGPVPIDLKSICEDIKQSLSNTDVEFLVKCPSDFTIYADPEKLTECFDELIANARHWFDKPEKKIELNVISPFPGRLPDFLDSSKTYVLIELKDNGAGIPVENKQRIFDAFFTTYDHGTGLGLALIRRIIEGHGGGIIETGIPGQGADFEIYLPIPKEEKIGKKSSRRAPKKRNKE